MAFLPDPGISLQLSLAATWTEAVARGYTLSQVTDWMCRHVSPALAEKVRLSRGEADLVVFDADAEFRVEAAALQPAGTGTPYLGRRLRSVVERTYLRGRLIYERGQPFERPQGRVLTSFH